MPAIETIKAVAQEYRNTFTTIVRNDETIWTLKDEYKRGPDISDTQLLVAAVHDDREMAPDDYRYEWTVDALSLFADTDDPEEAIAELEPDIYTHDLIRWLGSRADRYSYVDYAVENFGHSPDGIIGDIMLGQLEEIRDTYTIVLRFITERAEEREGYEEEDEDEQACVVIKFTNLAGEEWQRVVYGDTHIEAMNDALKQQRDQHGADVEIKDWDPA